MRERDVVIYHGDCYDGFGAAWAAYQKLGPEVEYHPAKYGQPPPDVRERRVWVVDFSYPRDVLLRMDDEAVSLTVLDHHKTAQADLEGLPFCTFDMEKSGAVLTWEHFLPGIAVSLLLQYVQDRDLWRFELPHSREFSAALRSYPMDFAEWDRIADRFVALTGNAAPPGPRQWIHPMFEEGTAILRHTQEEVRRISDRAVWVEIRTPAFVDNSNRPVPLNVPMVNATSFFSEVGDELCRRHPDAPFGLYYMDRDDGKRQWGMRSRPSEKYPEGFDTSEVARSLGGGGHRNASGFVTSFGEWPAGMKLP